jgi:hypothetical protein
LHEKAPLRISVVGLSCIQAAPEFVLELKTHSEKGVNAAPLAFCAK